MGKSKNMVSVGNGPPTHLSSTRSPERGVQCRNFGLSLPAKQCMCPSTRVAPFSVVYQRYSLRDLHCGLMLRTCAGESRCVDAFTVALFQAYHRKEEEWAWYVSTLELQLASLDFCRACRRVPTLHFRVLDETPRTLWAPRGDQSRQKLREQVPPSSATDSENATDVAEAIPSRVPEVRAACLTWALGHKTLECSGGFKRWGDLRSLRLPGGGRRWPGAKSMEWPRTLKVLMVDVWFDELVRATSWPAHLQELTVGLYFNRPLSEIVWPASLRRLSFEPGLDSIDGVVWPPRLQQLSLGSLFDHPIAGVVWPASLQRCLLDRSSINPSLKSCGQRRCKSYRLRRHSSSPSRELRGRTPCRSYRLDVALTGPSGSCGQPLCSVCRSGPISINRLPESCGRPCWSCRSSIGSTSLYTESCGPHLCSSYLSDSSSINQSLKSLGQPLYSGCPSVIRSTSPS